MRILYFYVCNLREETFQMKKAINKFWDHPFIAAPIIVVVALAVLKALGTIPLPANVMNIGFVVLSLCVWFIYLRLRRDSLPSSGLKKHGGLGKTWHKALVLMLPSLILSVLIFLANLAEASAAGKSAVWDSKVFFYSLFFALEAGVVEEITNRGIPVGNGMRVVRTRKKAILLCLLTSAVFGLIHLINLFAGATVSGVITQCVGAFGMGFYFAALYLRTGSIIPGMIVHFLNDFIQFYNPFAKVEDLSNVGLELSNSAVIISIGRGILIAAVWTLIGFFFLRKKKWHLVEENFEWKE